MKLIMKEQRQFDKQHLRQREITSIKIILQETICFKRWTSQPSLQTANMGRTVKIQSSDHLSYCLRKHAFPFAKCDNLIFPYA